MKKLIIHHQEPDAVEKVLKVPIHTLDGKKIDPKHATPKNRPKTANKTKKIFVGGVSQDTSVDEVKAYFNQFGKVEEAVMLMDQQTKRHRGFGFVSLADGEFRVRLTCLILILNRFANFRGCRRSHLRHSLPHDQEQEGRMQESPAKGDCHPSHPASVAKALVAQRLGSSNANRNGRRSSGRRRYANSTRGL